MKIKKYTLILLISAVAGCNQSKTESPAKKSEMPVVKKDTVKNNFADLTFAAKKIWYVACLYLPVLKTQPTIKEKFMAFVPQNVRLNL